MDSKKAQVWVETVVYTLIVFAMIGLVLSFVKPKIDESKDRTAIEQNIRILEEINYKINEVKTAPGNKRIMPISIKKGNLNIDGEKDRIFFEIESQYKYSEPGIEVEEKGMVFFTKSKGEVYDINITQNYKNYNITFKNNDSLKRVHPAPGEYELILSNQAKDSSGKTIINFELN